MTTREVVFRHEIGRRLAGVVEYILLVPALTMASWLGAGIILGGLAQFGLISDGCLALVGGAVVVLSPVVAIWFAVREYRRRAGGAVTIGNACVKIDGSGESVSVPFDEVREVRLAPHRGDAQCVLVLSEGGECRLPADIAPFSVVQAALEESLLCLLAEQMGRQLVAGDSFRLRESSVQAWLRILRGAFLVVVSGMLIVTIVGRRIGVQTLADARCQMRRGWRGRKTDFEVDRQGIRPSGSQRPEDLHSWSALRELRFDEAGFVLRYVDGRAITASVFAENFWPLSVWLKARGRS